ncbi:MAG TPA: SDR family oxidoreductase [Steroidobacteraceae bacterium]|nr:SDR family oxidoreductase [Steroidobacteraceae bacterium]HRX89937.1 SDR family oxidoreductase [Steroidobacteraceae bacterium]
MSKKDRKVAIVTGSATGVGAAAALMLAQRGCNVVINYTKSEKEARETERECQTAGAETILYQGDIGEESVCRGMAQAAFDKWGRLDYLINNAAKTKFNPYENLDGLSAEDFLAIYRVNVVGAYQMVRAVAPFMRKGGRGSIVNNSSIGGITGIASSMAYAASKAALNMMTQSLSLVLGPEIRINAIAPGAIQTRWLQGGMSPEQYQQFLVAAADMVPLKMVPTAEQIAEALVWFLEGASAVTGEVLMVDAGLHCGRLPPTSSSKAKWDK